MAVGGWAGAGGVGGVATHLAGGPRRPATATGAGVAWTAAKNKQKKNEMNSSKKLIQFDRHLFSEPFPK